MRSLSLLLVCTVLIRCNQEKTNRFSDPDLGRIATLQDMGHLDSLLLFLDHAKPLYRNAAALALASLQDTTAAVRLGSVLLDDPDVEVRKSAAFALGQTGGYAAANALIPSTGDLSAQFEVLEALGKVVPKEDLGAILMAEKNDSITLMGTAWGIYRAGLRGVVDTATVGFSRKVLASAQVAPAQFAAAHFFNRANYPPSKGVEEALIRTLRSWNAETRMAAVGALRKFNSQNCLRALSNLLDGEDDYRVKVNVMRVLVAYPWSQTSRFFDAALRDPNPNVGIAAAEAIRSIVTKENVPAILRWAREAKNGRIQAHLYESVLSAEDVSREVMGAYQAVTDNYHKAWLLSALSKEISSYGFIQKEFLSNSAKVIKSSAAEALLKINRSKDFPATLRPEFASIYRSVIAEGDLGAMVFACEALKDPTLGYKELFEKDDFLQVAAAKLSLPKDFETLQVLEAAIAYFKGTVVGPGLKNQFNNPIDWSLAKSIPPDQKVMIETTKGKIILQLFIDEAPGSVVNFVKLTKQKYFDGKYFHRVVPNFVVQTGCNRGDGFGSEDFSIRSEFSKRRYKTGSVGMASAGKNTEGTQWFITHSPTPHLDGKYTIFAEVVSGMEVVHMIEVGDRVIQVSLVEN